MTEQLATAPEPFLLPCAFCGAEGIYTERLEGYRVECKERFNKCPINGRTKHHKKKVIAAKNWNTRTSNIDFLINNRAPNEDSCTIKILAGDESLHITVWKEEDQSVHVNIEDNLGDMVDLVLGQEGETYKL